MKLQRWFMHDSAMPPEMDDDMGDWCHAEDVAALEAENAALRAEVERLKAPPKV